MEIIFNSKASLTPYGAGLITVKAESPWDNLATTRATLL